MMAPMPGKKTPTSPNPHPYVATMIRSLFRDKIASTSDVADLMPEETWTELDQSGRSYGGDKPAGSYWVTARGRWSERDGLALAARRTLPTSAYEDRVSWIRAHEALARALENERLLGSFNYGHDDPFPVQNIDLTADNILAWLDRHGFRIVSSHGLLQDSSIEDRPLPAPTVFDFDSLQLVRGHATPQQGEADTPPVPSDPPNMNSSVPAPSSGPSPEVSRSVGSITYNVPPGPQVEERDAPGDVAEEAEELVPCPRCGGIGCMLCDDTGWMEASAAVNAQRQGWIEIDELEAEADFERWWEDCRIEAANGAEDHWSTGAEWSWLDDRSDAYQVWWRTQS